MAETLVRMQDKDGHIFNIAPGKDMEAWMALNPGATPVDAPAEEESNDESEGEEPKGKGKK